MNFSSITNSLNNIHNQDFSGKKAQPLISAKKYASEYMAAQILNYNLSNPS